MLLIKVSFFVINFIDLCRNFKCIEFDSGNVNGYLYLLGFVLINIIICKLCWFGLKRWGKYIYM